MSTIANRYADALFTWCQEAEASLPNTLTELQTIAEVLHQDPKCLAYFADPGIPQSQKLTLVMEAFQSAQPAIRNALALLTEHQRLDLLPELVEQFEKQLDAQSRRVRGVLTSAAPVSEKVLEQVAQAAKHRLGADDVLLDNVVDPSLLGGASLQVGDVRLDGSFATQLQHLLRA
ncbi:MAG: ATP synthase F1 subunit delta [Vampirovibrionales bacterium]